MLGEFEKGTTEVNPLTFQAGDATGVQQNPAYTAGEHALKSGFGAVVEGSAHPATRSVATMVFDIAAGPWTLILGTFSGAGRWTITV